jgi:hypothetical protein
MNLLCELVTSFMIWGIHMGDVSKLGWLIGLVEHAMWADSLYFLYLLFQFPKPYLYPSLPHDPLHRHVGLILIFLEDPL